MTGFRSPQSLGGSPVWLMLRVEGVDARFAQAVAAGARVQRELSDEFHGAPAPTTWSIPSAMAGHWLRASNTSMMRKIQRRFAQYAAPSSS